MRTLVVAPHPDDEMLGCGGTLLRRKAEGAEVAWLIVTGMTESEGWPPAAILRRQREIEQVTQAVGFDHVFALDLPPAGLDRIPMSDLVSRFSEVFREFLPEEVFVPHREDVHTDHRAVFDAVAACSKWFRYASVKRVLAYETLSETEFGLDPEGTFRPNSFVDITRHLDRKLEIMSIYHSEVADFPFPRSAEALRALAMLRGAASGTAAAEAFHLLRERQ